MTTHRKPRDGYPLNLSSADLASGDRGTVERAIRDRVQTLYLGDGVMLARVLGRHKMFLHTSDRGFACHVAMDGFWESWITQFFARTLKPGMVAVDVGANYGYYTLLFGDAVTASGQVVAVEPNPRAARLLRESVLLNGMAARTRVHEVAAGPPGLTESRLFVPSGEPKNAQLVEHDGYPGGDVVTVPVATLDALTADFARVDLVKIDAEGAEVGIIAGMQDGDPAASSGPGAGIQRRPLRRCARFPRTDCWLCTDRSAWSGSTAGPKPVRPETVLTTQVGEDWILYFKHDRTGT